MIEGVDFTVSYAPVAGIHYLCIFISIASSEGLNIFVLEIFNTFQNDILPNTAKIAYLSSLHLYLEWIKIKRPKHPLDSRNQKDLCIHEIKSIQ